MTYEIGSGRIVFEKKIESLKQISIGSDITLRFFRGQNSECIIVLEGIKEIREERDSVTIS
ncbi:MAG: hypothetical protein QXU60_02550 [Sulfolobales archaeon]